MKTNLVIAALILGSSFLGKAQDQNQQQPAPAQQGTVVKQTTTGQAAQETNKYLEFNYSKLGVKERKVIPYPPLREADVVYARRIQRMIDVKEKKNLPLNWALNPLSRLLYTWVTTGEAKSTGMLKAYTNDSLTHAMNISDIRKLGGSSETKQYAPDSNAPDILKDTTIFTAFDPSTITKFLINEEWIFDKQRGEFFPRIIAIAPMYKPSFGGVAAAVDYPMFWVSYLDLRPLFIKEEIFNRQNDAMRLSYYDFFEMRLFSSHITKESNEFNSAIADLPDFKDAPMDALYESERIKEELFNWEHDLWEY